MITRIVNAADEPAVAGGFKSDMRRRQVRSRSIASVGYSERRRILELEYRNSGRVYDYLGVPPGVHDALLAAQSIGRFVNLEIKLRYPVKPIR